MSTAVVEEHNTFQASACNKSAQIHPTDKACHVAKFRPEDWENETIPAPDGSDYRDTWQRVEMWEAIENWIHG